MSADTSNTALLDLLYALVRSLSLYDPNNHLVVQTRLSLQETLRARLAGGAPSLQVRLTGDETFIDGRLVAVTPEQHQRMQALAEQLARCGLNTLVFTPETSGAALERFVEALTWSVRTGTPMSLDEHGGIAVMEESQEASTSVDVRTDQMAARLYCTLTEATRWFLSEVHRGADPSLQPLIRTVTLMSREILKAHGVYQMLCLLQPPEEAATPPLLRAAVAIEAMAFGAHLGLGADDLRLVGLSGILLGCAEPRALLARLMRLTRLGDEVEALLLVAADCLALSRGKPAGRAAWVVSVAERYHHALKCHQPPLSPPDALKALREDAALPETLTAEFLAHKGPLPLGTIVRLERLSLGVVISHGSTPRDRTRPIVAMLDREGELRSRIDLLKRRDIRVVSASSALERRVNFLRM